VTIDSDVAILVPTSKDEAVEANRDLGGGFEERTWGKEKLAFGVSGGRGEEWMRRMMQRPLEIWRAKCG
jgi:hypothetical protein